MNKKIELEIEMLKRGWKKSFDSNESIHTTLMSFILYYLERDIRLELLFQLVNEIHEQKSVILDNTLSKAITNLKTLENKIEKNEIAITDINQINYVMDDTLEILIS